MMSTWWFGARQQT